MNVKAVARIFFLSQISDPGLCISNEGTFLKYWINIYNNFKGLLFCFHTFGDNRSIDDLDPRNKPGTESGKIRTGSRSRDLGLLEDVWHQKYETKTKKFWNYLKYFFNRILKISLRSRYRALDPNLAKKI